MCKYTVDQIATGLKIKETRKKRKITVAQICDHLGLFSEQAVYKWQRGEPADYRQPCCAERAV